MAVYREEQGYCDTCRRNTLARGRGVNHVLHLILSLFCCGFWLWVWAILCLLPVDWRCTRCGDRVTIPAGVLRVVGFALLGVGFVSVAGLIALGIFAASVPRPTPSTGAVPTEGEVVSTPDAPASVGGPEKPQPKPAEVEKPKAEDEPRAVAGKDSSTVGRITAEVASFVVGRPKFKGRFGGRDFELDDDYLILTIRFSTSDQTVSAHYVGFNQFLPEVTAKDEFGNRLIHANPSPRDPAVGDSDGITVRDGQPVTRVLLIEKPLPASKRVEVDISARCVGEKGTFRFTVPLVQPKPVAAPDPKVEQPATRPDPKPEPKPETPPPLPTATLTPPKGEAIYLGSAAYIVATAKKEPEARAKWEKDGNLRVLITPTEVQVVSRGKDYSRVMLDGKEWVVETRWLPGEGK